MVWLCMCMCVCVTVPPCPTPQGTPNEWRVDSSLVKYSDQFTLRVSYTEGGTKTPIVTKTRR